MSLTKYPCPACGYLTIENPADWDICPICFWEDDVFYTPGEDRTSSANRGMAISEAQANFILYGAVDLKCKDHVRQPTALDQKGANWKLIPRALDIVKEARREGREEGSP